MKSQWQDKVEIQRMLDAASDEIRQARTTSDKCVALAKVSMAKSFINEVFLLMLLESSYKEASFLLDRDYRSQSFGSPEDKVP